MTSSDGRELFGEALSFIRQKAREVLDFGALGLPYPVVRNADEFRTDVVRHLEGGVYWRCVEQFGEGWLSEQVEAADREIATTLLEVDYWVRSALLSGQFAYPKGRADLKVILSLAWLAYHHAVRDHRMSTAQLLPLQRVCSTVSAPLTMRRKTYRDVEDVGLTNHDAVRTAAPRLERSGWARRTEPGRPATVTSPSRATSWGFLVPDTFSPETALATSLVRYARPGTTHVSSPGMSDTGGDVASTVDVATTLAASELVAVLTCGVTRRAALGPAGVTLAVLSVLTAPPGGATVRELRDLLGLGQATVYDHLAELRKVGLVEHRPGHAVARLALSGEPLHDRLRQATRGAAKMNDRTRLENARARANLREYEAQRFCAACGAKMPDCGCTWCSRHQTWDCQCETWQARPAG